MQLMLQTCKNYERLKNKSILITGATGMLASYYMYFLMYLNDTQSYNIKIYALVRNKEKLNKMVCLEERQDVIPVVEDVTSPLNIDKDLDYIVHMASSANPKNIVSNPDALKFNPSAHSIGSAIIFSMSSTRTSLLVSSITSSCT